ncbi:Uncharacterised protein [Actinobaculum suis]|uniref:Helix-turn-helix domain-containing protein n=1 Tax=Actinobaculum suis TaxID=1657 RepID=A0A7Z8Y9W3_9ACTO|nr:hypothetical protein [Actinobaculum suis]VDG76920.1 Uncharacterised protein [Actinobaculum suis]
MSTKSKAFTLTAYAPLSSLVRSLERAGWGTLHGRAHGGVRSILRALAARLPDKSAEGLATEFQLAQSAGISVRWARRCLGVLEKLGVIKWTRGGILAGKPRASFFRVSKKKLLAMVKKARGIGDERTAKNNKDRNERLARCRNTRFMFRTPVHDKTSSVHAELTSDLLTSKEGRLSESSSFLGSLPRKKAAAPSERALPSVARLVRESAINAKLIAQAHNDERSYRFRSSVERIEAQGKNTIAAIKQVLFGDKK